MLRRCVITAALLTISLLSSAPAASAEAPVCTASGLGFPELTSIEVRSPRPTGRGRSVELAVQADFPAGGDQIIANYLQGPVHNLNTDLIHLVGTVPTNGATTVAGTVPAGVSLGDYPLWAVVLVDDSGCLTFYYNGLYADPDGQMIRYEDPGADATEVDAQLDFAPYELTVADLATLPPDPSTWSPSQKYFNALVELFLGRAATRDEILAAESTLAANGRIGTTQSLADSEEWAGTVIDDIYQAALDRDPDAGGRAYWVGRLLFDGRTRDIAISIYGSPEAYDRAGGTSADFVDALYNRILGRNADPGGRTYWIELLDSGEAEPWQVVASFWESIEFRNQRVERVYQRVLHRSSDQSGLGYWSERLLIEDDVALAALLASSDEFYNSTQ